MSALSAPLFQPLPKLAVLGGSEPFWVNIGTDKVGITPVGVYVSKEAARARESYPPILPGGQAYVEREGIVNEFPVPS
jgi:hypothetical protein